MGSLSKNITHFRKKSGLSQLALAKRLGVSKSTIFRWETGESGPSVNAITQLCKILSITTDSLLLSKEDSNKLNSSNKNLSRRLRKIEQLNVKDQKALFSIIDAYLKSNT